MINKSNDTALFMRYYNYSSKLNNKNKPISHHDFIDAVQQRNKDTCLKFLLIKQGLEGAPSLVNVSPIKKKI